MIFGILLGAAVATAVCFTYFRNQCAPPLLADNSYNLEELQRLKEELATARADADRCKLQAAQADSDLTDFASIAGHDLRAPLRGIRSIVEWVREDDPGLNEKSLEHLVALAHQVQKMDALLEGLLRYARIGCGKDRLVELDTAEVLKQAVAAIDPPDGITISIQSRMPLVLYDDSHLHQVFHHLIENAVRHLGKAEGEVRVEAEENPTEWQFTVRDNGQGIEGRNFERIFKIFQSLSPVENQVSGLGLALVKKIVERHGGEIVVRSVVGEGSEFTFSIPKSIRQRVGESPQAA